GRRMPGRGRPGHRRASGRAEAGCHPDGITPTRVGQSRECGLNMGWKQINGHSYYYRSVREGDRVRTEYVGGGEAASLIAQLDGIDRDRRETERWDRRAERDRAEAEDRELADWFERVEAVATGALLAAGYHKHRGQWR